MVRCSAIIATGSYEPETRRTNEDLEKLLGTDVKNGGTTKEWIEDHVGIKERRIAQPHETCEYMAKKSLEKALEQARIDPRGCVLLVANNTQLPELNLIPCRAVEYQDLQGLNKERGHDVDVPAFDIITDYITAINLITAACTKLFGQCLLARETSTEPVWPGGRAPDAIMYWHGRPELSKTLSKEFDMMPEYSASITTGCASTNYALAIADQITRQTGMHVAVTAVDDVVKITNPEDRNNIILFGALSSTIILGPSNKPGFLGHYMCSDGSKRDMIRADPWFGMDGPAVQVWAGRKLEELAGKADEFLPKMDGQNYIAIPHQANLRMLNRFERKYQRPTAMMKTVVDFGNTSTASIPHALDTAIRTEKLRRGDYFAMFGFGAGLSAGMNAGIY